MAKLNQTKFAFQQHNASKTMSIVQKTKQNKTKTTTKQNKTECWYSVMSKFISVESVKANSKIY